VLGAIWGQDTLQKDLLVAEVWMWRLGGSHGEGGCSWLLRKACGADAEDAALNKSMLIPLSAADTAPRWQAEGHGGGQE